MKQCWVITDGRPGNENPALGLAEAVARLDPHSITPIRVDPGPAWRRIALPGPARLVSSALCRSLIKTHGLAPPWPDLVIGCGKSPAALCASLRHLSGRDKMPVFAVQVLRPPVPLNYFDLVIVPEHDRLTGANVLPITGSLSRVTKELLADARSRFPDLTGRHEDPVIAALIGGSSRKHRLTGESINKLFELLEGLRSRTNFQLLVTTSRRTGPKMEALITKRLADFPALHWDGRGENPYFAYLAHADTIIVTSDSINMVSDAAATGKPVYVHDIPGGAEKFTRFHQSLAGLGITRPFAGVWEDWTYPALSETSRAAQYVISQQKKCRVTGTRQV